MSLDRSFLQIVRDLKAYILNKNPSLDTKEGSPWLTCFIEPQAQQIENMYYLLNNFK